MTNRDYPRDPDDVTLTRHAMQQMKDRNIGVHEIKETIRQGKLEPEAGFEEHEVVYRLEFPGVDLLLTLDADQNNIESVFYDDEQGAEGGSLSSRQTGNNPVVAKLADLL